MNLLFLQGLYKNDHAVSVILSGGIIETNTCGVVAAYLQSD